MKVSKSFLKQIVKECLLEILSEGLGNVAPAPPLRAQATPPRSLQTTNGRRAIDENRTNSGNTVLHAAIREVSGGSSDMASIFADTARTTLSNQMRAERAGPSIARADLAAEVAAEASPDQLFGEETTNKWAELAFMPSSKKI